MRAICGSVKHLDESGMEESNIVGEAGRQKKGAPFREVFERREGKMLKRYREYRQGPRLFNQGVARRLPGKRIGLIQDRDCTWFDIHLRNAEGGVLKRRAGITKNLPLRWKIRGRQSGKVESGQGSVWA